MSLLTFALIHHEDEQLSCRLLFPGEELQEDEADREMGRFEVELIDKPDSPHPDMVLLLQILDRLIGGALRSSATRDILESVADAALQKGRLLGS